MKVSILVLVIVTFFVDSAIQDKCYEINNSKNQDCCNQKNITNPCAATSCLENKDCVLYYNPDLTCKNNNFPLEPRCERPCPQIKCLRDSIPTRNSDNCPSCFWEEKKTFINPCEEPKACGEKEECILRKVTCVTTPCYPIKECRPICPVEEVCPENCLPYVDTKGCKRCYCCNPCVNTICSDGKKCILNQVQCIKSPCPAQAKCV